jgi:hypothetical protein
MKKSADFAVALTGFNCLTAWRAPEFAVVIWGALGGIALV